MEIRTISDSLVQDGSRFHDHQSSLYQDSRRYPNISEDGADRCPTVDVSKLSIVEKCLHSIVYKIDFETFPNPLKICNIIINMHKAALEYTIFNLFGA